MKLKLMGEDLAKFQSVECLTIEDVLGILQNVGRDIKRETGHSLEACEIRDPDALMGLLIWMGKLYSRIYDANSSALSSTFRLESYKSLAADLQKKVAEQEAAEPDLLRLQEQIAELQARKSASAANEKALTAELVRLQEAADETEKQTRELEERAQKYRSMLDELNANNAKLAEMDRNIRNLLEVEIPEQREKSVTLERQKYQLLDTKRQITDEIEKFEEEIQKIRDETAEVEQRKKEKREEQIRLTEKWNMVSGEVMELDEKAKSLKKDIAELEQQLSGESKEGLSRILEARKADLEARIESCASLETAILAYKGEIETQEKLLAEKEETLKNRKNRAKEVEEALKDCESELFHLEQRRAELETKETRLKAFEQIHQALIRNADTLEGLPGFESYSEEIQVEKMLRGAGRILEDLRQAINQYTRLANDNLEAIK